MEWSWLGVLIVPLAGWVVWRARRLETAARWLLRASMLFIIAATLNPGVRCDRPLDIDVLVDLSPSTRSATFRDPQSVEARLRQLLPGWRFSVRYFADGEATTSAAEIPADQTRLPDSIADAVILLSDGRFTAPVSLPPVFAVLDPALDAPADGRIENLTVQDGKAVVTTHTATAERRLVIGDNSIALPAGAYAREVDVAGSAQAILTPSDLWPENDSMAASPAPPARLERLFVDQADQLPTEPAAMLGYSAIVLAAGVELSDLQQDRLVQYARDLGGVVILSGSPARYPARLRSLAPLSATPPQPQAKWIVLLDASGSMTAPAGAQTRWSAALDAAAGAVEALEPQERVSIGVFSRTTDLLASDQSPAQAALQIKQLRARAPSGPTGLQESLEFIGALHAGQPTRLLIISDADATLSRANEISQTLRQARVSVFVIGTGTIADNSPVQQICRETGGALLVEPDPRRWALAFDQLLAAARGEDRIADARPIAGESALAGLTFTPRHRFHAFGRAEILPLARQDTEPVIASRQTGLGTMVSVAAELDRSGVEALAQRLQQPPADPRFTFAWEPIRQRVRVKARTNGAPWNKLSISLRRDSLALTFKQIAPGLYEAPLDRRPTASVAVVEHAGSVIARRALPSRYAPEFDQIGNDRVQLAQLAATTGGRLVEAGDTAPLAFPRATVIKPSRPVFASLAAIFLGAALVLIRAPYLIDRLKRRRRSTNRRPL